MSRAMFAGVFIVVGWGSVEGIGVVHKTLFLLRDQRLTPPDHPLLGVKRSAVLKYVLVQWFFFAAIIAVSETIGALALPNIGNALLTLTARSWNWVPRHHHDPYPRPVLHRPTIPHRKGARGPRRADGQLGRGAGVARRTPRIWEAWGFTRHRRVCDREGCREWSEASCGEGYQRAGGQGRRGQRETVLSTVAA